MEMEERQFTIRCMEFQDIPRSAEIFCEQFPELSWTRLGESFIRKLITWNYEYHPGLALVAETDGHLIGFIVGATGGIASTTGRYCAMASQNSFRAFCCIPRYY